MSRRWIVVALIFAGILISYIDRGNLGIAAPSIMREFSFTPATMGVLLSAFFWAYTPGATLQFSLNNHFASRGVSSILNHWFRNAVASLR